MERRLKIGLMGGVAAAMALLAAAELREFRLPDGRTLKAEPVSYQARTGKIQLKRADGKLVWVKPSVFVVEDRDYLLQWRMAQGMKNEKLFQVECKRCTVKRWKETIMGLISYGESTTEKEPIGDLRFEKVNFIITLKNRNRFPLRNIHITYVISLEEKGKGRWLGQQAKELIRKAGVQDEVSGEFDVEELGPNKKIQFSTEPAILVRQQADSSISFGGDYIEEISKVLKRVKIVLTMQNEDEEEIASRTIEIPYDK